MTERGPESDPKRFGGRPGKIPYNDSKPAVYGGLAVIKGVFSGELARQGEQFLGYPGAGVGHVDRRRDNLNRRQVAVPDGTIVIQLDELLLVYAQADSTVPSLGIKTR